ERNVLLVRMTESLGPGGLKLVIVEQRRFVHVRRSSITRGSHDAFACTHHTHRTRRHLVLPSDDLEVRTSDVAVLLRVHFRDAELDDWQGTRARTPHALRVLLGQPFRSDLSAD